MGIKGLRKAIRRWCPAAESKTIFSALGESGMTTLAVDTPIFMHKSKAIGMPVAQYFGKMLDEFITNGFSAYFVWDGKPHELKAPELDKRRDEHARKKMRIDKLQARVVEAAAAADFGAAAALTEELDALSWSKPNSSDFRTVREVIEATDAWCDSCNFVNVNATHDAECAASTIVQEGKAQFVLTEDFDSLAFGAPLMVTGYSPVKKRDLLVYDLAKAQDVMAFTPRQWSEYCVLLGSDLCNGGATIRQLGMVRAYKLLKSKGSIEKILNDTSYEPMPGFLDNYKLAVTAFHTKDVGVLNKIHACANPGPPVQVVAESSISPCHGDSSVEAPSA